MILFFEYICTPNSGEGLKRLDYRTKWDIAFKKYILSLEKIKPVVICGDLNVANKEIDGTSLNPIIMYQVAVLKKKLTAWRAY